MSSRILGKNKPSLLTIAALTAGLSLIAIWVILQGHAAAPLCPDETTGKCRPFAASSPWNTPISDDPTVTVDANSANFMTAISNNNMPLTSDVDQYTLPVYLFDPSTPKFKVQLRSGNYGGGYYQAYDQGDDIRTAHGFEPLIGGGGTNLTDLVPVPSNVQVSAGDDSQMTIWNPVTGELWEFWQWRIGQSTDPNGIDPIFGGSNYTTIPGAHIATNAVRYHTKDPSNTYTYKGRLNGGGGGRGAGTPYLAGNVMRWEVDQGEIDHALAFAFSSPGGPNGSTNFRYPATKTDGAGVAGTDPPEGTLIQLNPSITDATIQGWGCTGKCLIIARALRTYGMYVIDNSGSSKIYLEDRKTANWDPSVTRSLVSPIPWSAFQVMNKAPTAATTPPPGSTANLWVDSNGGSCQRQATAVIYNDALACPSLQAAYNAATGGDTVQIKAGNYTTAFNGGSKSPSVILRSADGSTAVGANSTLREAVAVSAISQSNGGNFILDGVKVSDQVTLTATAKNITFSNSDFAQTIYIDGLANSNIIIDTSTFNNQNTNASCTDEPARIHLAYGSSTSSGVTVQNSMFDGGNKDGVQTGVALVIKNNTFTNIREKSASDCQHTDAIQGVGVTGLEATGNFLHDNADGIVDFDDTAAGIYKNNACYNIDRGACITLYSDTGSIVEHNTAKPGTNVLELDKKPVHNNGTATVFRNNVGGYSANSSTLAVNTNNLYASAPTPNISGSPTFASGASPTTFVGFFLTSGSSGHLASNDIPATDVGIGAIGTPPPPPPPVCTPAANLGNINCDAKIDVFDLSILLSNFGKTPGQSSYPAADLNGNNLIDIFDLSILLSHYGT